MIVGNWKMNKTPKETEQFISAIKSGIGKKESEVVLCVPFVDIHTAVELTNKTSVKIGAQNCHFETSGAYTGEISAQMLKESAVEYVILGHSERRTYFNETDEIISEKVKAALSSNLQVILCIGETLQERENNRTKEKISMQIKKGLEGISKYELVNISIAYEPVWAIGTGKTATKEIANNACAEIRQIICESYGDKAANSIKILYGGSVNANNAPDLLAMEHIDGLLIGGASLDANEFLKIINA